MPTNLPAEYYEVDEQYRAATTTDEKIRLLEELISTIPKHKGTDKLRADLRRKLSKLKTAAQTRKGTAGGGSRELYELGLLLPDRAGLEKLLSQLLVGLHGLAEPLGNPSVLFRVLWHTDLRRWVEKMW